MRTKMVGGYPTRVKEKRSGFEERVHGFLVKKNIEHDYEGETLHYLVPEKKHRYLPDFSITGTPIIVEAKGRFDPDDRKKMLLLKEQYPERDFRMLFMRNNKIAKNSKTTYGDWCDKHGIKWHADTEGKLPSSWIADIRSARLKEVTNNDA